MKHSSVRRRSSAFTVSALVCLSPVARGAPSQGPRQFIWERGAGAESCVSESELRASIVRALGADPFTAPDAPLLRGDVIRSGDELVATVRLRQGEGAPDATREFRGPASDCAPLTNAVALAVTLALSADDAGHRQEPDVPPVVPSVEDRPPLPKHAPRGVLLGEAVWTLGTLPRPVIGLGVEARYGVLPRLSFLLAGEWLPRASEAELFQAGMMRAKVGLCVLPFRGESVAVLACGTGQGGAVRIENQGATVTSPGSHPWFGAGLSMRASARVGGRWLVEGGVEGVAPTTRSVYATASCPLVGFQEPPVTLGVFASTGVLF